MSDWIRPLHDLFERGEEGVLVSVVEVRGSTPREVGARMLVTGNGSMASIGGGRLEYRCEEIAREMLNSGSSFKTEQFTLGATLGQCCGGVARVSFDRITRESLWVPRLFERTQARQPLVLASRLESEERIPARPGFDKMIITEDAVYGESAGEAIRDAVVRRARQLLRAGGGAEMLDGFGQKADFSRILLEPMYAEDFHLVLFGAGHVGKALVQVLTGVEGVIRWIDSRADIFPVVVPSGVMCVHSPAPELEVDAIPPRAYFLVMTHSHALDQLICEKILRRNEFTYCGLIGSASKRIKFEKRFRAGGIAEHAITRLTCPIGVQGISGKHPREIAIAVAAELLQLKDRQGCDTKRFGKRRSLAG